MFLQEEPGGREADAAAEQHGRQRRHREAAPRQAAAWGRRGGLAGSALRGAGAPATKDWPHFLQRSVLPRYSSGQAKADRHFGQMTRIDMAAPRK